MIKGFGLTYEIAKELFKLDNTRVYEYEIKERKEKRSLNANAYMWHLISQIAEVMKMSKEDCYHKMLKDYGVRTFITVSKEVDLSGYFDYYEAYKESDKFAAYVVYKGSSKYNTKEMSVLLDGVVMEAINLNIQTIGGRELEQLKSEWSCVV